MMASASIDLPPDLRMSRDEYRRWAEDQPRGRFERVEGVVVAMAPERAIHADRKAMIWLALRRAVTAAGVPCHVYPDGMTVEQGDSDFEPDAVLHCGERLPGNSVTVPEPLVIVEVLSPGTKGVDLTRKLAAYFRIPSVRHYLIVWAERRQIIHHRRRDDGPTLNSNIITEGEIRLDPPGITITLDEVYAE